VEAVEHLDCNLSAFGRYCVVDGAQLLVALPGKINFPDRVAGVEATVELGLLALGEVFHTVAEEPADLIQRVVFVAAAAQAVLLHPTPDLIDHLSPEPHHMEGIEHRHRVREAVMNRVGIAAERVQGGVVDAVDELLGLVFNQAL
jgi:hypothetical protein